jgi:hypothetical protein
LPALVKTKKCFLCKNHGAASIFYTTRTRAEKCKLGKVKKSISLMLKGCRHEYV